MRTSILLIRLLLGLALVFLVSCNYQAKKQTRDNLTQAAEVMETSPAQALSLLKGVDAGLLTKEEYEYFVLLQVNAWDANGLSIALCDTSVLKARDYFIHEKNAPKSAYACFVAGGVYNVKGDEATALYYYKQADEWAEKANYSMSNFQYSKIPYCIALIYSYKEDHKESLRYLEKAFQYMTVEQGKYTNRLYALELKALSFAQLKINDSASHYYNQALSIAEAHNDTLSKNRIYYNTSWLLSNINDNALAVEKCKEALALTPAADSVNAGKIYLALGVIYHRAGEIDSAYTYIYKAKPLLANVQPVLRAYLNTVLAKIETSKGNPAKAAEYTREYDRLKAEHDEETSTETAKLQAQLQQQQEEKIAEVLQLTEKTYNMADKQAKTTRLMVAALFLVVGVTGVLVYKNKKMEDRNKLFINEIGERGDEIKRRGNEIDRLQYYEKKASIRHIFQRRDLLKLMDWVQANYEKDDLRKDLIHNIEKIGFDNPWHMHEYYRAMFYDISVAFPTLTETEYRILCLFSTELMNIDEIAEFLRMPADAFEKMKNSMEDKVLKADISQKDMSLIGTKVYSMILLSCVKRANPSFSLPNKLPYS